MRELRSQASQARFGARSLKWTAMDGAAKVGRSVLVTKSRDVSVAEHGVLKAPLIHRSILAMQSSTLVPAFYNPHREA